MWKKKEKKTHSIFIIYSDLTEDDYISKYQLIKNIKLNL
jgi:hypothetical protein